MRSTSRFLKHGAPMAAAAPILLSLMGLSGPALACTGNPDDPAHCINNAGQQINGAGDFIKGNVQGIPGGGNTPGFVGSGRFGLTYNDATPGTETPTTRIERRMTINIDGSGSTDGGVEFGGRIRLSNDDNSGSGANTGNQGVDTSEFLDRSTGFGFYHSNLGEDDADFRAGITLDNGLRVGGDVGFVETGGGTTDLDAAAPELAELFGNLGTEDESFSLPRLTADNGLTFNVRFDDEDPETGGTRIRFDPQITSDNGIRFGVDLDNGRGAVAGREGDEVQIRYFTPRFSGFSTGLGFLTPADERPDPVTFGLGFGFTSSFDGFNVGLKSSDLGHASEGFAVGLALTPQYNELVGTGIKYDYVPLDEGSGVKYDLGPGTRIRADYGDGGSREYGGTPTPTPPAPATPPVTGETIVEGFRVPIGNVRTEINLVETADGTVHAVDPETGHDYGEMRRSSSGFSWKFKSDPVPKPATPPAQPNAVSRFDAGTQANTNLDGFATGSNFLSLSF